MKLASATVEQLDRRALAVLLSLVVYLVLSPTLENHPFGSLILIVSLYTILVTAILQFATLRGSKEALLFVILVASLSMTFMVLSHVMPTRALVGVNQSLLILFFTILIAGLFNALGRPGAVTRSRLYTSVSLYLMLAILWTVVYRLIETLYPGSLLLTVSTRTGQIPGSFILYMSLVTLTGLGTGDLVPATQLTRMLVAMESVAGVLYVAITIARLVSAYQRSAPSQH